MATPLSNTPSRRRFKGSSRWRFGATVGGSALALFILVVFPWKPHPTDPRQDGRSASEWFTLMVRASTLQSRDAEALLYFEARAALLRLGTNAVPILVDRSFATGHDTTLRRLLRAIVSEFPRVLPPGRFLDPQIYANEALALLDTLHPPASQVFPCVVDALGAGGTRRIRALEILSHTRDTDDGSVARLLIEALTNAAPNDAWIPARQLSRLDPPPAAALPHFLTALKHPTVGVSAGRYLSRLGPQSRSTLPVLERTFVPTNSAEGLFAAMLFLEVAGDHPAAESVIRTWAESTSFTPWNELTPSWVIPNLGSLGHMLSVRHPATLAAIESLARSETEGWEPRGLAHVASGALERIAPARAVPLYADQMKETNRENVRIIAAGSLLRIQRTNDVAFRLLTHFAQQAGHLARMAAKELREVDPDWNEAIQVVRKISQTAPESGARSAAEVSLRSIEVRGLERAAR